MGININWLKNALSHSRGIARLGSRYVRNNKGTVALATGSTASILAALGLGVNDYFTHLLLNDTKDLLLSARDSTKTFAQYNAAYDNARKASDLKVVEAYDSILVLNNTLDSLKSLLSRADSTQVDSTRTDSTRTDSTLVDSTQVNNTKNTSTNNTLEENNSSKQQNTDKQNSNKLLNTNNRNISIDENLLVSAIIKKLALDKQINDNDKYVIDGNGLLWINLDKTQNGDSKFIYKDKKPITKKAYRIIDNLFNDAEDKSITESNPNILNDPILGSAMYNLIADKLVEDKFVLNKSDLNMDSVGRILNNINALLKALGSDFLLDPDGILGPDTYLLIKACLAAGYSFLDLNK